MYVGSVRALACEEPPDEMGEGADGLADGTWSQHNEGLAASFAQDDVRDRVVHEMTPDAREVDHHGDVVLGKLLRWT